MNRHILQIPPGKVGSVIGKGGATIKTLERDFNCKIRIRLEREEGQPALVEITGRNQEDVQRAIDRINVLVGPLAPLPKGSKLYIDLSNFLSRSFFKTWSFVDSIRNVERFAGAIRESGCTIVCFCDGARVSDEANEKFIKRRLKEVGTDQGKNIPQSAFWILTETLHRQGIELRFSLEDDNDHTLAYYAHRDGALVLSGDQDFFRYYRNDGLEETETLFSIYSDFYIVNGKFVLERAVHRHQRESIMLLEHAPRYSAYDDHTTLYQSGVNMGGVPSPLVKRLQMNPHIVIRPLRQAVYRQILGEGKFMKEKFPLYSQADGATFSEELVEALTSPKMEQLLNGDPVDAYEYFFPIEYRDERVADVSVEDWEKHKQGCFAVTLEQCCFYRGRIGDPLSFSDCMIRFAETMLDEQVLKNIRSR